MFKSILFHFLYLPLPLLSSSLSLFISTFFLSPRFSSTISPFFDSFAFSFQYAHENGCEWDKFTCMNAALGGHLDCLKVFYFSLSPPPPPLLLFVSPVTPPPPPSFFIIHLKMRISQMHPSGGHPCVPSLLHHLLFVFYQYLFFLSFWNIIFLFVVCTWKWMPLGCWHMQECQGQRSYGLL